MSAEITGRSVAFAIHGTAVAERPLGAFHLDFRNGIKEKRKNKSNK